MELSVATSLNEWEIAEGGIAPLGATWEDLEQSYQFVLYSKNAGAVVLLLYREDDLVNPVRMVPFEFPKNKTSRYWHMQVKKADAQGAKYYAYRVYPSGTGPVSGFDSDKILLDPYAKGIFFPPGHDRLAACRPGSNAGKAPLGLLPQPTTVRASRAPAPRHGHDLIIYEMHVRGFTIHESSGLVAAHRGSFSGIVDKIPYLKDLGITAIELMPVHQFDPAEGNYWGYMTLSFFTPHLQYGAQPEAQAVAEEFRSMVDALHAAGIEVFLDVVYNHTTEGGWGGPTYCYRGIDNTTYYVLAPPNYDQYVNFSASGNDLRTAHAVVRRLVMDSLRFWANDMGVDGFRFDLASILARTESGELDQEDPPLISEMSGDSDLASVRLIAEPWQGEYGGGYIIGRVFPGKTWRQWNDHFRDCVRSFVKGDPGLVPDLMIRLYGSTDLFPDDFTNAFRPTQSVNYIDSHDGFCLYDLVAYTHDSQRSWNCGFEGETGAPQRVLELRKRQVKNFCCLLFLANGTPMFCMGDEFLRTQGGNDNPYNVDSPISWVDWTRQDRNSDIFRFFKLMIAFRKSHPALARSTGWRDHVHWYGTNGGVDQSAESRSLAYFLGGADMGDNDLYVMINAYWQPLNFAIQEGRNWRRVIDTSLSSGRDIVSVDQAELVHSASYTVQERSIVVLAS